MKPSNPTRSEPRLPWFNRRLRPLALSSRTVTSQEFAFTDANSAVRRRLSPEDTRNTPSPTTRPRSAKNPQFWPGAGAQGAPLSAARPGIRAAEPGMGDGHRLHSHGEGLRLSRRRARLVLAARAVVACLLVLHRGVRGSAPGMESRRFSTPIKVLSLRVRPSPTCSRNTR